MRKDFEIPEVKGVSVAIIHEELEGESGWYVYLINENNEDLKNVLVSSSGYKKEQDEVIKTSVLRHMIADLPPMSYARVESIMDDVFHLNNQYWVSFQLEGVLYDKKYIFLPDSIQEKNTTLVPVIGKKGILISS
tara:strand:- start:2024 stop:2428 length:405 start_codon:yes stop_codon:yes gene_type:complete